MMSHVGNYNLGNMRNATDRTFPRRNRPNRYVNCSVCDQDGGGQDNLDYNDAESYIPDYYGDRSQGRALMTENGANSPRSELETEALDGRHTDSDVEAYLGNRIASGEYRGAKRTIERDALKTVAGTNSERRDKDKNGRTTQKFAKTLRRGNGKFRNSQRRRNQTNERRNHGGDKRKWRPKSGINLAGGVVVAVGGYEQRRAGRETDGEFACFECGDITHVRDDCLIYQARRNNYKGSSQEAKNGGGKWMNGGKKRERGDQGKGRNLSAVVRFAAIGNDTHRDASLLRTKWRFLKKIERIIPNAKF